MVLITDTERECLIIYLISYLLGRRPEALDIAERTLQPGVPLTDIMRFTGVLGEELAAASQ